MRNTEFTIENLASAISSESSLSALVEMIGDMGLEITDMAVSLKSGRTDQSLRETTVCSWSRDRLSLMERGSSPAFRTG